MKSSKKNTQKQKLFYLLLALLAMCGIGLMTYLSSKGSAGPQVSQVDPTLPAVQSEGYVVGSPDAPLELIEFGDFECIVCARFAALTEPEVRTEYVNTGKVRFRYIDYPLPMHPNTWNASRAAACADEQGKFWEMHDALFNTQDQWSGQATRNPDRKLKEVGRQIPGMDAGKFDDCIDTKRTQAKVQAHAKLGEQRQIGATPTFFAGTSSFAGYMPYDQFKAFLDSALAKVKPADPTKKSGDSGKKAGPPAGK